MNTLNACQPYARIQQETDQYAWYDCTMLHQIHINMCCLHSELSLLFYIKEIRPKEQIGIKRTKYCCFTVFFYLC